MKRFLSTLLCLCFAAAANTATAATTYTYTGTNYASATGAYTTSMKITGSFTTASPLAANLANAQIGPGGLNLVTSWSFNDGLQTLTDSNSTLFGGNPSSFTVSTDTAGHITTFLIEVMSPPGTNTVGQSMNAIAIASFASPFQVAVVSGTCSGTTAGKCSGISPGANTAMGSASGTFAITSTATTAPAPMLAPALLALLALALLAFAYRMRRDPI